MAVILITGGARSGKSLHAERRVLASASTGRPLYIATAEERDEEMADRIAAHRARRGPRWETVAAPVDLSGAIARGAGKGPILVDCLTIWASNLMLAGHDWREAAERLCGVLRAARDPVVLVTNEVGMGIVPDNVLARRFRDAAGTINQMVAATADEVEFVVAGLPMKVK